MTIQGANVDDLIRQALEHIREKSRCFYRESIREDLEREGRAIVDRHAGNGRYVHVILEK